MTNQRDDFDPKAYNPEFERHFLAPKYWGTWIGVVLSLPLALLPLGVQKWLAKTIAKKLSKSHKGPAHELESTLSCASQRNHLKSAKH